MTRYNNPTTGKTVIANNPKEAKTKMAPKPKPTPKAKKKKEEKD